MQFSAVLFDLDGTLLDTLTDISDCVNRALVSLGFSAHPKDAYKTFVGNGMTLLAKRALPQDHRDEKTLDSCIAAINREYEHGLLVKTAPYPCITELLDKLVKRDLKLAVVSNKPHALTVRTIETLFVPHPFACVLGERSGVPTKPDPAIALEAAQRLGVSPSQCLYVGDTGIDMKTGTAAGMYPVGVLWGFRQRDELLQDGAKKLITHPLQLLDLL